VQTQIFHYSYYLQHARNNKVQIRISDQHRPGYHTDYVKVRTRRQAMYVKRSNEARSCKNCCSEKAI